MQNKWLWVSLLVALMAPVFAESSPQLTLDLNKLEQKGSACRLHMLFHNITQLHYERFELDLVFFDKKNIILRQINIDAAPLRSNKQVLKPFDIPDLMCNEVGHLLLNDVVSCKVAVGEVEDCLANVRTQSTSSIPFRM